MAKYKVYLDTCGNPDRYENPYKQIDGATAEMAYVDTIEEAQAAVRAYIDKHYLGSGNWAGGNVWDINDNYIGRISYNGRFWDKDTEYGKLED